MYDLSNSFKNTFEVMFYTVSAMREVGFSKEEIEDYMIESTTGDNANLIDVSIEYINKCNDYVNLYNKTINDDSFYINDDELDFDPNSNDDEYSDYSYLQKKYGYDEDDFDECYEGFDSCSKKYYSFDELNPNKYIYVPNYNLDDDD